MHPNPLEGTPFWSDVIAWGGVTPRLLPRVALFGLYALGIAFAHGVVGWQGIHPIHLGYTGALLAVLLVLRTNSSYDRWWEARKLWGAIVNQSRNLAIQCLEYGPNDAAWKETLVRGIEAFCHAARSSLRTELGRAPNERDRAVLERVLGDQSLAIRVEDARHMPSAVARHLAHHLAQARIDAGLDGFAFHVAERELARLVDHVGGCERIRCTPLPRVHAIKLRRFIVIYLLGLPLALATDSIWVLPLSTMLVAYALLAIDQIAHELQNPFSQQSASHLPLDEICAMIEGDLRALLAARR
ncbi:bestrophin family protein [Paraliomyxa miuraensis]|uniref:bestrophin family protein n=1 Tax=Paraliomyxa miuraensis TaxID=376150 RepID=UPI002257BA0C|nr:bestrophin family ion channel [Paraliomyxa miuraensis]MCX4240051.1 hypothetical protein [Paraliomyxa miuraensis]